MTDEKECTPDMCCDEAWKYLQGEGVEQDFAEAMRLYRKAAEKGYAKAQYNLGVMYENGRGVEPDYEEAMQWYIMAAAQN